MTILDEIVRYKRTEEIPRLMQRVSRSELAARAFAAVEPRDFVITLRQAEGLALIAELKKASPSKGLLCPDFDPLELTRAYVSNGAAAISVLTDHKYFHGGLEDLETVSAFREQNRLAFGILRKDFIVSSYQIYQARAAGADAVLLIVAALSDEELRVFLELTWELGMEALVEVHDRAELERALSLAPSLIGINSRDLHTFSVDLDAALRLRLYIPPEICVVVESGIRTRDDVERLKRAGVDAMLVGESLVTAADPGAQVRRLLGFEMEGEES